METYGPRPIRRARASATGTAIWAVLVIAALYFGRELFVPLALALLLTFLLTPAASGLARLRVGRVASSALTLAGFLLLVGGVAWLGALQLADMVLELPVYQANIRHKLEALQTGNPGVGRAIEGLEHLASSSAVDFPAQQPYPPAGRKPDRHSQTASVPKPLPVQMVKPQAGLVETLGLISTPMLRTFAQGAVVIVFALFLLIQRCDLRDRLLRLLGIDHLQRATSALDEAGRRISRYLLAQSCVNCSFGLLLGLGLYGIGVPNAVFWGAAAAILRFVPYLGSLTAGAAPFLLSLAALDGWTKPAMTLGLFVAVEVITSTAVEPWLYGAHTGISALAILISASFWTLLWGPLGLVLSLPLTVCLLVLGRYAPPLRFLSLILGDEPVLAPAAAYYQRLLALDDEEAQRIVEIHHRDQSFVQVCDTILVPALSLSERDRHRGELETEQEELIYETTRSVIEEIGHPLLNESSGPALHPLNDTPVLCLAAKDEADYLVSQMLSQVLHHAGFRTRVQAVLPLDRLIHTLQADLPAVLIISALPPHALTRANKICRELSRAFPELKVIIGYWDTAADSQSVRDRLKGSGEMVVTTLEQAATATLNLLNPAASEPLTTAQVSVLEEDQRAADLAHAKV